MFKAKSITLRPFETKDLETYRDWINDAEICQLIERKLPVTQTEHLQWYQELIDNKNAVVFAIETIKEQWYIGNIWLWNIDWICRKAELRILIGDKTNQKKGYGVEAIKLMTEYAFSQLNLKRVYAHILDTNHLSINAFESAGYIIEGTLRNDYFVNSSFHDNYLVAITNS